MGLECTFCQCFGSTVRHHGAGAQTCRLWKTAADSVAAALTMRILSYRQFPERALVARRLLGLAISSLLATFLGASVSMAGPKAMATACSASAAALRVCHSELDSAAAKPDPLHHSQLSTQWGVQDVILMAGNA